jgi:hypothetical protein
VTEPDGDRLWLYIRAPYTRTRHLIFVPEALSHRLSRECGCQPEIRNHIHVHKIITPVEVDHQRREKEH